MTTKQFIGKFNFNNPDWSWLPSDFPQSDTEGLTREEKSLFEAIKIAWVFREPSALNAINRLTYLNKLTYMMIELDLLKATYKVMYSLAIIIVILSTVYYFNIEYGLGMQFLIEMFV
jgi:hypothetical protein